MTTASESELLTRVGPGTPMGNMMREYWIPALISSELKADAPPTRVHQVDAPLAYAANLEALALPSVEKIIDAAKAVTYR